MLLLCLKTIRMCVCIEVAYMISLVMPATSIKPHSTDFADSQNLQICESILCSVNQGVCFAFSVGGSPGLVVMGGDSCSEGRGFESRRRILDGHNIFSHTFVVRIVMFV